MQVLTTVCPYCKKEVDSTIDHLDSSIVCPYCKKPFELEMPTAMVVSVHDVDKDSVDDQRMATEPDERTLVLVHPIVFRARPIATLVLASIGLLAITALILTFTGIKVAGFAFGETVILGPASLLTWVATFSLLVIFGVICWWKLLSQFTTLTVTSDRTIYQQGLISRDTSEVQHNDVRNIQLHQSFVQRLLNVGGIAISSSGQDDLEVVAQRMPDPKQIIELIRANQT